MTSITVTLEQLAAMLKAGDRLRSIIPDPIARAAWFITPDSRIHWDTPLDRIDNGDLVNVFSLIDLIEQGGGT